MLGVIFVEVSDVRAVAVPPGLERSPSQPSVGLLGPSVCPGDLTAVDHALHLPLTVHRTLPGQRTILFVPGLAVTARLVGLDSSSRIFQNLTIVTVDNLAHILHALVTHLDIILVD